MLSLPPAFLAYPVAVGPHLRSLSLSFALSHCVYLTSLRLPPHFVRLFFKSQLQTISVSSNLHTFLLGSSFYLLQNPVCPPFSAARACSFCVLSAVVFLSHTLSRRLGPALSVFSPVFFTHTLTHSLIHALSFLSLCLSVKSFSLLVAFTCDADVRLV